MVLRNTAAFILCALCGTGFAQDAISQTSSSQPAPAQWPEGFKIEQIGKQLKDFQLDSINLSTPFDYFLSRAWVRLSGKRKHWKDISTSMYYFDADAPDEEVEDYVRSFLLNEHIDYMVTYRDSVACIVTHPENENYFLLNNCWIEDGKWVNAGQGMASDEAAANEKLRRQLPQSLYDLPRIDIINRMPDDVTPFVEFLSNVDQSPETFMLDMLSSHKLVINGEYHRRKVSWDMLKKLIALPEFPDKVGCIFMELPSWRQPLMDEFLSSDTLNGDLLIQIFQDEQLYGWWDRGEFEFLRALWHLNSTLPQDKKIRVVLADYQVPYSLITSAEEAKTMEDRNTHMANIIIDTIDKSEDTRNNLFLVGCGHASKSKQEGFASAANGQEAAFTAGRQLTDKLGKENVFIVFQHVLPGDNTGRNKSPIRGGIFDKAFELNGNKPVGFVLENSPFGNEPFDGIYELKYHMATGNYSDNFDGYLFLAPLDNEPVNKPLVEIFTNDFITEMQRRASVLGNENNRWLWFGRTAPELTREYIMDVLLHDD